MAFRNEWVFIRNWIVVLASRKIPVSPAERLKLDSLVILLSEQ